MSAEGFRHQNLPAPPPGARIAFREAGFTATVSTKSPQAWIYGAGFVFLGGWLAIGLYGPQLISGKWDWLESIFGLPILAGVLLMGWQWMMQSAGEISVVREGEAGEIVQGAGWLVLRRRFRWTEVSGVEVVERQKVKQIVLRRPAGDMKFGGVMGEAGREYLVAVIREGLGS